VTPSYTGRFAPSPTGPLHAGSLLAALASWLDARAHGGRWLVRIEDVDTPRCVPGADTFILQQLAACGLRPDEEPVWQSHRSALYQAALKKLQGAGLAYPCTCSRKDIANALKARGNPRHRHGELIYPGTCRHGLPKNTEALVRETFAWRFRTDLVSPQWNWIDRRLGPQKQQLAEEVGDFVLMRADGLWAYQLAVVVDDAAQGVTHVVRGEDLADNTARQLALQTALGMRVPRYLHTPLVLGNNGEKLSKQNAAAPLDLRDPLAALSQAAQALGLGEAIGSMSDALAQWVKEWRDRWGE
jgi:glutamyl-Q tRNA(Asp) synthetase